VASEVAYRGVRTGTRRAALCCLACVLVVLLAGAASALGAVSHRFLPGATMAIGEGVPAASGASVPGPVSAVSEIAGSGGHVWLAESLQYAPFGTRVDQFDALSGAYSNHQITPEGGVSSLTEGLAIGGTGGEELVYVGAGKESKYVVAVFNGSAKLQAVWTGAHTANKSFSELAGAGVAALDGVAVDDSGNLTSSGDVYVATRSTKGPGTFQATDVVDVLRPGAGGGEGEAVGQLAGTCKSPGTCSGAEVIPFVQPGGVAVSGFNGDVLVEDEVGAQQRVVDVFEPVSGMPGVYSFLFTIDGTPAGAFGQLGSLAVDPANGNIYVAEQSTKVVDEFSAGGALLGRLTGASDGGFGSLSAVGVDGATGNVFAGDYDHAKEEGAVDVFGPDIPIPDVGVSEPPAALTAHSAKLRGVVNPVGAGEAHCEFEYGPSSAYGRRALCGATVPEGSADVPVESAEVAGLTPDTTYFYRLDASNASAITNTGECPADCGRFTTPGPGIAAEAVTDVSSTSATLLGSVDPHGKATSYYFQYGTTDTSSCEGAAGGCEEVPLAPGAALGAGSAPLAVSQHPQDLLPNTTYHYRLVAESELHPGEVVFFAGPDQTFITQAPGGPLTLLDDRRWELVSPADKRGALLSPIENLGLIQAAANGDAISYVASLPTDSRVAGYSEVEQILSRRASGGVWSSEGISAAHSSAPGIAVGTLVEYPAFSEDLGEAIYSPVGEFTSLAPCVSPAESERTPYLRDNDVACGGGLGTFRPLVTGVAGVADVPQGTKFGGKPANTAGEVAVAGASPDLQHVALSSKVSLAPGVASEIGLYEWSAGAPPTEALEPVGVLPDGTSATGQVYLGAEEAAGDNVTRNAISEDGSLVVWHKVRGHLYVRDMITGVTGKTLQLDQPEAGCLSRGECGQGNIEPIFQGASNDDGKIFFTDKQRLTANAGNASGLRDLYVCELQEVAGERSCKLTDLTPPTSGSQSAADVQGDMLGASADGSWVYFVANGALAPGAQQGTCQVLSGGGTCSLYVEHDGANGWKAPVFVAALGGEDWPDWKGEEISGLPSLTARVSTNGEFVTFMSDRPLTGYDNHDAVTGEADEEVFLYDQAANRVSCVSCNPTGSRPHGVAFAKLANGLAGLVSNGLFTPGQGVAASVPAWSPSGLKVSFHQSRYLSDTGRVFFDSSDDLVPSDVNRAEDVYEYEPPGVGSCTSSASTFVATEDGCVQLISPGTAAGESGFLDASESGDDVFLLTAEPLVREDTDSSLDIYDAHVCTSATDCPPETETPPACTTADACRAGVTEQPAIFGAPASATLSGQGNVAPAPGVKPPAVKAKTKSLTRAQKLAKALKSCRTKHNQHKRATCEKQARKTYRRASR
jgi:hypothetical protein